MIGLVFWDDVPEYYGSSFPYTALSMEYFYLPVNKLVVGRINGVIQYNWTFIENKLTRIASRGHQAIFRPYYEYPGLPTAVPAFLKSIPGYQGQVFNGEEFMDWRSPDLQAMHLDMFTKLAQRYDNDNRVAFVESGFGFWSEYHISDGPDMVLGYNFPSGDFQQKSITLITSLFKNTPVLYSIDIADIYDGQCPVFNSIKNLPFGSFDDSAFVKSSQDWNDGNKQRLGWTRYQTQPLGGEIAYEDNVQQHALDINGPEGTPLPTYVANYHYTFLIASDQVQYKYNGPLTQFQRIQQVGQTFGYKFTITSFQTNGTHTQIIVKNTGVAPAYKDMYLQVSGVQSTVSLKRLQPGNSLTVVVQVSTNAPTLKIVSPWITSKQTIQYEANL
uniref:DUF4832 domain-containing protein n=1 Tax=Acrobeloides nanus TaxID=290746 RepID=A0A914EDC2_9BILA